LRRIGSGGYRGEIRLGLRQLGLEGRARALEVPPPPRPRRPGLRHGVVPHELLRRVEVELALQRSQDVFDGEAVTTVMAMTVAAAGLRQRALNADGEQRRRHDAGTFFNAGI